MLTISLSLSERYFDKKKLMNSYAKADRIEPVSVTMSFILEALYDSHNKNEEVQICQHI